MHVPLEWLKEFVAIRVAPQVLAKRMTMAGLEVTGIEQVDGGPVFDVEITPNRADWLSIIGVAREVLTLTRGLFDQVQLRYNAGEVLRNELLRTQIESAKAENAVLEADKQIILDTANLNILLGREAQQSLVLIDQFTYQPYDIDPDQLLTQALQQRTRRVRQTAGLRLGHPVADSVLEPEPGRDPRSEGRTDQARSRI